MAYNIITSESSYPTAILTSAASHPTAGNTLSNYYIGFVDKSGNLISETATRTFSVSMSDNSSWITDVSFIKYDETVYKINLTYSINSSTTSRIATLTLDQTDSTKYQNKMYITQSAANGTVTQPTSNWSISFASLTSLGTALLSQYRVSLTTTGSIEISTSATSGMYSCGSSIIGTGTGTISISSPVVYGTTFSATITYILNDSTSSTVSNPITISGNNTYTVYLTINN